MLREERRGVGWKVSSLALLVTRTLIVSDQGLTFMISFSLNCLLRGPISKYSHTLSYRFSKELHRDTLSPQHPLRGIESGVPWFSLNSTFAH